MRNYRVGRRLLALGSALILGLTMTSFVQAERFIHGAKMVDLDHKGLVVVATFQGLELDPKGSYRADIQWFKSGGPGGVTNIGHMDREVTPGDPDIDEKIPGKQRFQMSLDDTGNVMLRFKIFNVSPGPVYSYRIGFWRTDIVELLFAGAGEVTAHGGIQASCGAEGPAPYFTQSEEKAMAGAESLLSVTAAFIDAYGCEAVAEVLTNLGRPFRVAPLEFDPPTFIAKFPYSHRDPIELQVTVDEVSFDGLLGTKYDVDQINGEGSIGTSSRGYDLEIQGFHGDLDFSYGGAILTSDATFMMNEFGALLLEWGEHNIKDFWLADQSAEDASHIKDCGTEVIGKIGFPLAKWQQYSDYFRWNAIPGQPGPGRLKVKKWRITPWGLANALIEMEADVGGVFGIATLEGKITVLCGTDATIP